MNTLKLQPLNARKIMHRILLRKTTDHKVFAYHSQATTELFAIYFWPCDWNYVLTV